MDFKEKYQEYETIITKLQEECTNAERQAIVGETNLANLLEQKDRLIKECETLTGVSIDKVPDIITKKQNELDSLMAKLSQVNINDPVTQEKVDNIKAIVSEFSIPAAEQVNAMGLFDLEANLKTLETNLIIAIEKKQNTQKDIQAFKDRVDFYTQENEDFQKVNAILTQTSSISRDNARAHFEKIVTDALQFVTQSKDYEFIIQEIPGRAKASYEFYIKSTVNGVECIQKPEDSNGGGFIDIISVACKYAYREIFNDPRIQCDALLYDEPGKMISEKMSVKFAEYIKFLGNHYNRQTIMVTHNDNLANIGDMTYYVTKSNTGVTSVLDNSLITDVNFDDIEQEILEAQHVYESQ